MRTREQIGADFNKRADEGLGLLERHAQIDAFNLEVLLDIRDLLVEVRDQSKEVVIDFVPPDYGREDVLVGKGEWKCPGCGSVLSMGTRHRCPGPRRQKVKSVL